MAVKVLSVRARYCPGPLSPDQFHQWDKDATNCKNLLNEGLRQGYKIIERWPSVDGNVLNVVLYKEDENPINESSK